MPLLAVGPGSDITIDTLEIGELNIYSNRPVSKTALKETRIDSAVLSQHAGGSLSELISEASPVFIKSLGRGGLSTVSFRGTAPSHTLVKWNGLTLNSPMLGMVDFSDIPVFFIDEVNLLHGNSSLTETAGALGGIINLGTTTAEMKGLSGTLMQGLGSYGTYQAYGRLNARWKGWSQRPGYFTITPIMISGTGTMTRLIRSIFRQVKNITL